ncbi:hypothetical protein NMR56_003468 [Vibrio cholerae]|uniref:AbiTii domain-containing protein n=1 Tax=Vibrio cholerae TaxID=666 RepID=UPI000841E487|nr:hypothetical protein [Vibrio cholerae]EGQ7645682.1 hypothetical protein [Vibrio cholerae]EGR2831857.1 hypothetical protein [Vibrio cholerae]EJL6260937.1 hypothetical protein [Vibrio cholerae]EJL6834755.1 hypothetical protein [Vibrio cholerae]EKG0020524.1 hypothetical protein [Vibrio cholerae]
MSGLVLELQKDALDNDSEVSSLLRKALVISKKLGVYDIEAWLSQELNGYDIAEKELPDYREVNGVLKAYNPMRGLIPLHINDPELSGMLSSRRIGQPISELESLVNSNDSGTLTLNFPPNVRENLMSMMTSPMEPILQIGIHQIDGVLGALRTEVLNWALELERKGIIGEGMTFSNSEKRSAENVNYTITNNIGRMHNSQLQQATNNSNQSQEISIENEDITQFIEYLKLSLEQLKLNENDQAEIEAEIVTIESQLSSPKPKKVVIGECLKSVRNIVEGTTGSLVATGILAQLSAILSNVS